MRSVLRKMGNSSGIIIPKMMLTEIGMKPGDDVELAIEDGRLFIEVRKSHPRADWAADAQRLAELGDDGQLLGEFGNEGDDELTW
jgi:antitoxin MazE